MFKINSFLGCVSLRKGVLLIGLLGLVLQLAQIIFPDLIEKYRLPFNYIDSYQHVLKNAIRSGAFIYETLWALLIVGILANVVLIAGVLKDRPKFFLPYLIFSWGQLVLIILDTTHKFLSGRILDDIDLVATIITPLIPLYFVICVHSYYVDVKKQQNQAKETVVMPTTA